MKYSSFANSLASSGLTYSWKTDHAPTNAKFDASIATTSTLELTSDVLADKFGYNVQYVMNSPMNTFFEMGNLTIIPESCRTLQDSVGGSSFAPKFLDGGNNDLVLKFSVAENNCATDFTILLETPTIMISPNYIDLPGIATGFNGGEFTLSIPSSSLVGFPEDQAVLLIVRVTWNSTLVAQE